jgi:hypothetical protein
LDEEADSLDLKAALLARLHALPPRGFEDFVVHLLNSYGMELARVGGPTDEGVDAIGLAPVSDVLADRVAVQIKRYDRRVPGPTSSAGTSPCSSETPRRRERSGRSS